MIAKSSSRPITAQPESELISLRTTILYRSDLPERECSPTAQPARRTIKRDKSGRKEAAAMETSAGGERFPVSENRASPLSQLTAPLVQRSPSPAAQSGAWTQSAGARSADAGATMRCANARSHKPVGPDVTTRATPSAPAHNSHGDCRKKIAPQARTPPQIASLPPFPSALPCADHCPTICTRR